MKNLELPQGKYIFLWGGLVANAGGMTRAMLMRASAFADQGVDVTILCVGRGQGQRDNIQHYINEGYHLENVKFLFLEEYLSELLSDSSINSNQSPVIELPYEDCAQMRTYYKDGMVYAQAIMDSDKDPKQITYFNNSNESTKVEYYNKNIKYMTKFNEFEHEKTIRYYNSYYAKNGFCYMSFLYEKRGNNFYEKEIIIFLQKEKKITKFNNLSSFREWFFSEIVNKQKDKRVFCFCDPILDMEPGFKLIKNKDTVFTIGVTHGIGLGKPREWNSQLNPRLVNNVGNGITMDALILLTRQALGDFKKRFGEISSLYYLPNTISIPHDAPYNEIRTKNKVVYIGRFAPEKQCDHLIKAFAKVVKTIPDAKLYCFGRGDSIEQMKSIICSLEMQQNIIIEPFTNNPYSVYRTAVLSISTSDFEGMALSVCESLANGCPVASYNYKYGVQELLQDNENGYVVPKNDIDMLANTIIEHLQHPERWPIMSRKAFDSVQKYGQEYYLQNWITTLNLVVERKPYKTEITNIKFKLNEITQILALKQIQLNGILEVEGDIPDNSIGTEKIYFRLYNQDKSDYTIKSASWNMLDKFKFEVKGNFDCDQFFIKDCPEISICIEWQNSFIENTIKL